MTLTERIQYCSMLARDAEHVETCEAYIAELAGLQDVPLARDLRVYRHAYELGRRDRATLLKLEG